MTDPAQNPAPAATPEPAAPASKDDDPNIVGHLLDTEMAAWQQNQRASQQLVNEIGNLVVKVVRGVGQINQLEANTEAMLKQSVGRLGLAEDTRFQVMRDGRIRVIAAPAKAPEQAPAAGEITDEAKKTEAEDAPKGAAAVARAKAAAAAAAAKEAAGATPAADDPPAPPAPAAAPPAETPPAEAPAS